MKLLRKIKTGSKIVVSSTVIGFITTVMGILGGISNGEDGCIDALYYLWEGMIEKKKDTN